MCGEYIFYLPRVHIEATADNHVLGAIDQIIKTLVILVGEITGMQPATAQGFRCLFRAFPVPRHHCLTTNTNLANLSAGDFCALLVE